MAVLPKIRAYLQEKIRASYRLLCWKQFCQDWTKSLGRVAYWSDEEKCQDRMRQGNQEWQSVEAQLNGKPSALWEEEIVSDSESQITLVHGLSSTNCWTRLIPVNNATNDQPTASTRNKSRQDSIK